MSTKSYKELRWILRGLSGLIIAFSLFMFIGETFFSENPGKPFTINEILQLSPMGIGLIGLILAWKWEFIGGTIALVPFIVLATMEPTVLEVPLMYVWPLTAMLFILLWALSRNKTVKNRKSEKGPRQNIQKAE
jgi:hypothetical protein